MKREREINNPLITLITQIKEVSSEVCLEGMRILCSRLSLECNHTIVCNNRYDRLIETVARLVVHTFEDLRVSE